MNMLRNLPVTVIFLLGFYACSNEKKETTEISTQDVRISVTGNGSAKGDLPEMKFEEEIHDFGRIIQGEKVSYSFKFTNTGNSNLIIASAAGSCGCTVPEYSKEPVLPGKSSKIDVVFSSEGKSGLQEKTITVVTNCEPSTRIIKIKTNIIVPESAVKE